MSKSASKSDSRTHRYFPVIDFLRFSAALLVMIFHYAYRQGFDPATPFFNFESLRLLAASGWVGVEIFFVISGFVISGSGSTSSPFAFFKGRVLRLYPAVWICATVTLTTLLASGETTLSSSLLPFMRSIMLLPKGGAYWIDPVYWTLSVEISFYFLIFGLLRAGLFSRISQLALVLCLVSTSFNVTYAGAFYISPRALRWFDEHNVDLNLLLNRHGCFFSLGIWLWLSTVRKLLRWEIASTAISVGACTTEIWIRSLQNSPDIYLPLLPSVLWFASVGCIFVFSQKTIGNSKQEMLRTVGHITYPLYLVHDVSGSIITKIFLAMGMNKWVVLACVMILMIFTSWFICRYMEPKLRSFLNNIVTKLATILAARRYAN